MRIAIMQPTYLPWLGYFALMDQVDVFVLLNDVQFEHRSWQQRNRIRAGSEPAWLTVPVIIKGRRMQRIDEVEIDMAQPWQRKHLGSIARCYARAPFYRHYRLWLEDLYRDTPHELCSLNRRLLDALAKELGISTPFRYSAELATGADRVGRLIEICRALGATEYLSPLGSADYIEADNRFPDAGIDLYYQHYEHPQYSQLEQPFMSHLSVLDLLLNEGPRSLEILRSGIEKPYRSDELPPTKETQ
jgi:hypothetical protein